MIPFLIVSENMVCEYTLELPRGSNENPQYVLEQKKREKRIPLKNPLLLYKSGAQSGINYTGG